MKKLIIAITLFVSVSAYSQELSRLFSEKDMTFYGLDFTAAKCIGMSEFPGGDEMVDFYIPKWNDIFMVGKKKIRIGSPYKMKKVSYDTMVYQLNRQIVRDELIMDGSHSLKRSQIADIVYNFADKEKDGLGLVYIVESLNANEGFASIWISFFDIKTGELIIAEPTRGEGKGREFGIFWENAILRAYINSADDFKTWKKLYD